jgi:hypothetical protein
MLRNTSYMLLLFCLSSNPLIAASDLDDGIDASDSLEDSIQLKKNIQFIIRNAKAKAARGDAIISCDGAGNQTFAPGANLNGATIINLSKNNGATSVCNNK